MRTSWMGWLVLMLGGVVSSALAQKTDSNAVATDPALAGLAERWAGAIKDLRIPGLAVVVVKDDKIILLETLGVRDPAGNKPVTPDTMFYIASCTKTYVAALTAKLAEEGKLELDAPVKKYLPRFQIADADLTEKITVRDLLAHRKGLNCFPIVFLDAYTGEINEDRYYHFLKTIEPLNRCEYSNIHFTLAGRIIEAVEKKSWRDALNDRLFKPAGMTRTTGYASKMYGDADAAIPMEEKAGGELVPAERKTDYTMHAAGGLGTTARDAARWLRLHLNGGTLDGIRLLSPQSIEEIQKIQVEYKDQSGPPIADLAGEGFGLAWSVKTYKGRRLFSHGGGYAGTAANISFMPDEKIGVAVLANAGGPAGPFTELVAFEVYNRLLKIESEDMLPKLKQRAERYRERLAKGAGDIGADPATAGGLSLSPEKYAGVYESEFWGTLRIEFKNGKLSAKVGDLPVLLKSTGPDRFQVGLDPQTFRDAGFEIKDGRVTAASIYWKDYGEARFERKSK